MEKEFIPYEQALELKELEFNENCLARFDGGGFRILPAYDPLKNNEVKESWFCVTPLYQQAFRWFREKKSLCSWVYQSNSGLYHYSILKDDRYLSSSYNNETTYKEAELACLKKLIEIVKNK